MWLLTPPSTGERNRAEFADIVTVIIVDIDIIVYNNYNLDNIDNCNIDNIDNYKTDTNKAC